MHLTQHVGALGKAAASRRRFNMMTREETSFPSRGSSRSKNRQCKGHGGCWGLAVEALLAYTTRSWEQ